MISEISNASVPSRLTRADWIFILLLITLTLATRLPFRSTHLVIGDSVQYALGMERYNVSEYRPHPPGAFLFITAANAFAVLLGDANGSLTATAILFSVGTVVLLYLLSRDLFSREAGIVTSLLFLFLPLFWYHGEIAMRHTGGACFTTAIAFLSYRVYSRWDNKLWMYLAVGVLGLSGGVAQDAAMFAFPLVAFSVYKSWPGWQVFLRALGIFGVSVASWYVPTILLSGGFTAYSRTVAEQSRDYVFIHSILFGNSWFNHFRMLKDLALYSIVSNYFASGYAFVYLVAMRKSLRTKMRDRRFAFLLIWLLPPMLFSSIVTFEVPANLIVALPAWYVIIGYIAVELTKKFVSQGKVKLALVTQCATITLVHAYNFLGPPPQIFDKALGKPFAEKTWSEAALGMVHNAFFQNPHSAIVAVDQATEIYSRGIRSLPCQLDQVVVLHYQRSSWPLGLDQYYLPEFSIYDLEDYRDEIRKIRYGKNHEIKFVYEKVIRLGPHVRCVAVICQEDSPAYRELGQQVTMKAVPLGGGHTLFLIEQPVISLRSRGFLFTNR